MINDGLKLIDLITELRKFGYARRNTPVRFDFCGFVPGKLFSYRGFYDDLALDYVADQNCTVFNLLEELTCAPGRKFGGWKGGLFEANDLSTLWVSHPSDAESTIITGVMLYDHVCVLETGYENV